MSRTQRCFVSLPTPSKRTLGNGKTIPVWATFDLMQVVALQPTDNSTIVHLHGDLKVAVSSDDREIKWLMEVKAGIRFIDYDYRTEQAVARNHQVGFTDGASYEPGSNGSSSSDEAEAEAEQEPDPSFA